MTDTESLLTWSDVRSHDPEFAHDVLRKAYVDFTIRLSGNVEDFRFSQSVVTAPQFTVAHLRYSMAADVDAHGSESSLIVLTARSGHMAAGTGSDSVVALPGVPVLMPTDRTDWWFEMDDLSDDVVTLDGAMVDRAAASVFGLAPGELSFSSLTPVSDAAARYWNSTVAHVRDSVLARDEVVSGPLVLAEVTRSLATTALATFPNSGLRLVEDGPTVGRAEPAVLRRALTYIDGHAGDDIGVDDIAAAARIGVRGLQNLFRRHRGRTPLEELRRVRMALAHADLRDGDPTRGESVASIAVRWGFTHPGRFSVRYRDTYGCSPSDTLRS